MDILNLFKPVILTISMLLATQVLSANVPPVFDPENQSVKEIRTKELKLLKRIHSEKMILLDIRPFKEYRSFKIEGAIWVGGNLNNKKLFEFDKDATIIFYGYSDSKTIEFALHLKNHGFKDARIYAGGIVDWILNGYEVVNAKGKITNNY